MLGFSLHTKIQQYQTENLHPQKQTYLLDLFSLSAVDKWLLKLSLVSILLAQAALVQDTNCR